MCAYMFVFHFGSMNKTIFNIYGKQAKYQKFQCTAVFIVQRHLIAWCIFKHMYV